MFARVDGFLWLLLLLGPLLLLQRSLHRQVQGVFLLLTRRPDVAIVLFSMVFLPGILLHEGSHFLLARLLGVRTGRFSILPRQVEGNRLQLGYVETASTDWIRDALIGSAPLILGGAFVAYAGLARLGLIELWNATLFEGVKGIWGTLPKLFALPDFWVWFYLALAVSSTMLPSAADRRAWIPIGLVLALLFVASLFVGAGPWLLENLSSPLNQVLRAVAIVFGISIVFHIVLVPPLWGLRHLLSSIMGIDVV